MIIIDDGNSYDTSLIAIVDCSIEELYNHIFRYYHSIKQRVYLYRYIRNNREFYSTYADLSRFDRELVREVMLTMDIVKELKLYEINRKDFVKYLEKQNVKVIEDFETL